MSLERAERQPRPEIELLKSPPEITLFDHMHDLRENLKVHVGHIIYQTDKLFVTQSEYQKQYSPDTVGQIYIHNKQNGLPDSAMHYKRVGNQMFMQSAHRWIYHVIDDPEDSKPPLLVATEYSVKKTKLSQFYRTDIRKTILDTNSRDDLLWGEGQTRNLIRKPFSLYNESGKKIFDSVKTQIDKLPGFKKS